MDWNQFQQIIELLFKRFSTSFKLDQDQIEFTIEKRTVVYTRQEYEDICNSLMSFAQSPTYLSKSNEIEIIIDLVDSGAAMRLQSDVLTNGDDNVTYIVSAPSNELLLSFLSSIPKEEIRAFRRIMPARYILQRSYNDGEEIQLFDLIRRVLRLSFSMRIIASENTSVEKLQRYVNSFLFSLAYNTEVVFKPVFDIYDLSFDRGYTTHRRHLRAEELEPPKLFYSVELTEQYYLALSSSDPFVNYIAYYHIMEHFFDEVYDGALISGVKEILMHPGFSAKKSKEISKIIDLVQKKTKITRDAFMGTELEALELTIKAFVPMEQLFQNLYDSYPNLIDYYKTHEVSFSQGDKIDLTDHTNDKLPKKIAARIYKTRNSLVHSKSNATRVKERGIYHPFTDDKELAKEIPLMRIIAETIIIRSAEEI